MPNAVRSLGSEAGPKRKKEKAPDRICSDGPGAGKWRRKGKIIPTGEVGAGVIQETPERFWHRLVRRSVGERENARGYGWSS